MYGTDWDMYATCTPFFSITPFGQLQDEGVQHWIVEKKFSSNPIKRCQDYEVGDPLQEPARISGSFSKYSEEITEGYGTDYTTLEPLKSSSHEPLRGPKMEFEKSFPTVTIEQTLTWAEFNLAKLSELQDHVNEAEMWGLAARKVRLAHSSWAMQFWGVTGTYACSLPYYTRSCTFEINFDGWDREVVDEGTRALGFWDPASGGGAGVWRIRGDKDNVRDFNRYRDPLGEIDHVLLNGEGIPLADGADPVMIDVRGYAQANLFELYLPANLYFPSPQNWVTS
jgi:hypothetical protein